MAETFESYRAYLFSIAYRMLGSAMDAEDMVQETFLRYQAAMPETIVSLKAYLATILTRLCLDQLHLARRSRDTYLGPWLPEPVRTDEAIVAASPEERVEEYESLSLAFMMLLEELQPVERAVFLLREVFDYEYDEIATMLGKSEVACRQSFSRAKKHLADRRPRFPASVEAHRQMLTRFIQATQDGDLDGLVSMLAEDVTLWADGGGRVRGAATRPISGRLAVARFAVGSLRFLPPDYAVEVASVNGQPAIVIRVGGQPYLVLSVVAEGDRIQSVQVIANPAKLAHV
ncbi:MAG TPA: RNA polymerase sigma-70 factor [Ktedonobacterales bacterium]|nr:RNA polymerase sigma-70 factor [Ktedonobacterales bacterium]